MVSMLANKSDSHIGPRGFPRGATAGKTKRKGFPSQVARNTSWPQRYCTH